MPDEPEGEVVSLEEISFSKTRISDQVKEILKELVLKQKAGDKIPSEDEIARQLKVGKVTVREALSHLEAQGLIERRRGVYGGSFVAKPTSGKMSEVVMNYYRMGNVTPHNLVEFRCTLEPALAALAAQRITESEIETLKKIIETMEAELAQDKANTPLALEFHTLVADACHNPLFSHVMKALTMVFKKVLDQLPLDIEDGKADLDYSKQLYEAFLRRDSATAYDVMLSHFDRLKRHIAEEQTTPGTASGQEGGT
jgi:GntR family transcriptional regulator, transcriptional repressor for pyruvate dehydrogenase complex